MARKKVVKPAQAAAAAKATAKAAPKSAAAAAVPEPVEVKRVPGISVGIDFGTHGVSLAAYKNNTFELIVNDNGERTTPLYVSFNDLETIIGSPAREAALRNHSNTVHYVRSYLGYSVEELADYLKNITTYTVVNDENGKAAFKITVKGEERLVSPDELITLFAQKLRKYACDYWDTDVTDAVLALPLEFPEKASNALVKAIEAAGFNILATISDPIAAVLSFDLDAPFQNSDPHFDTPASLLSSATADQKCILVADIGCVKSSATLIRSNNGVLSIVHNNTGNVAGDTFDTKLHDYFADIFNAQNNADLTKSHRATLRLKHACETVKRNLSSSTQASVQLDALFEGVDLFSDISRLKFDMMCANIWDSFNEQLQDIFAHGHGVKPEDITHVILAGGTAALTKFQSHINTFLRKAGNTGVQILKHMHSGDTVVFGAAKQASILSSITYDEVNTKRAATADLIAPYNPKVNANTAVKVALDAYKTPVVVLSKNIYVKTFYNTYLPLLSTSTSVPSVSSLRLTIPCNIPEGMVPAIALYETSASNAIACETAKDLKCVGVYGLNSQQITALAKTPEGVDAQVTVIIRATFNNEYVLTVDTGYFSIVNNNTPVYNNLLTVNMLSKPLVAPTPAKEYVATASDQIAHHSQLASVAKIQQLVAQWDKWINAPKNVRFITKFPHMTPSIDNAKSVLTKVEAIVALPNPYSSTTCGGKIDVDALPSATELATLSLALRDAIVRVLRTKSMSVNEAKAYNLELVAQTAAPAASDDGELDVDMDYDDLDVDMDYDDIDVDDDDDDDDDDDVDFDFDTGDLD